MLLRTPDRRTFTYTGDINDLRLRRVHNFIYVITDTDTDTLDGVFPYVFYVYTLRD